MLRKQHLAVKGNVEHSAPSPDEFHLKTRIAVQFRLQTGGARQVVSAAAVLDDYSGNGFTCDRDLRTAAGCQGGLYPAALSASVN